MQVIGDAVIILGDEVLDLVRLKHKGPLIPEWIVGGEQQRIAITRAIVNNRKSCCGWANGNLDW